MSGDVETLRLVMAQKTIAGDEEEAEEAVANALKIVSACLPPPAPLRGHGDAWLPG